MTGATSEATAQTQDRPSSAHPGRTELGAISVEDRVVAKIAAQAVLEVPDAGTPARRVLGGAVPGLGANLGGAPKVDVDADLSVATIEVTVSVRWPASVPKVTAEVRRRIIDQLRDLTGLRVTDVRVHVSDLVTQTQTSARVR
ncbi:Asp23/Gls24 family envelope stress response protein [uncultured Jatrophihabitans sp.]|uniref:Asp23/Gls24 family envelope stress response protein n=1 Tax=uncultured Jatrophihabitans sp. TaxID=1610747 RepID=UPI0035C9BDF5